MTERVEDRVIYRRALRVAGLDVLAALLLALVGVFAVLATGVAVDAWAVPFLAAAVAGEQLWRQRTDVPREVPRHEVAESEIAVGPVGPWAMLGFWLLVAAGLLGVGLLIGTGNVLLGLLGGLALRDAVRLLQIVAWERRHGRRLVWRRDGGRTHAAVLAVS